jgi:hypothetical protein
VPVHVILQTKTAATNSALKGFVMLLVMPTTLISLGTGCTTNDKNTYLRSVRVKKSFEHTGHGKIVEGGSIIFS